MFFFLGVEMGISGGKERSWSFGVLVLIDFMFFADFFLFFYAISFACRGIDVVLGVGLGDEMLVCTEKGASFFFLFCYCFFFLPECT